MTLAIPEAKNKGFVTRKIQAGGAGYFTMNAPIISPITRQNKLIIPQIDITFTLLPNRPEFMVHSTEEGVAYKVTVK